MTEQGAVSATWLATVDSPLLSTLPPPVACMQGDAFRMLQARLQPIPLMALLSIREQQQPALAAAAAAAMTSASSLPATGSPAGSPPGSRHSSSSLAGLDSAAAMETPQSPTSRQRQQIQARPRLIEERRLVQLFKGRVG